MKIVAQRTITINLEDREAKMLTCLLGAMSARQMEDFIRGAYKFKNRLREVTTKEVSDFSDRLYVGLDETLGE